MKLLLTSGGLRNQSIINELERLVGKQLAQCKVVYIVTAANVEFGNKDWLIKNLDELSSNFSEVEIADIALKKETWLPRLNWADAIVVGGGHTPYLMEQIMYSGFQKELPLLLKSKVYVGISAGSIVATPSTVPNSSGELKEPALHFVNFGIQPHYKSADFPVASTKEKVIKRKTDSDIDYPLYALDDNSAVSVDGGNIAVISEGHWDKL